MNKSTQKTSKEQHHTKEAIKPSKQALAVQGLRGIIHVDENFDYKQILTKELLKKYNK